MRTLARQPVFWLGLAVAFVVWAQFESTYQGQIDVWHSGIQQCRTVTRPGSLDTAERETDMLAGQSDLAEFAGAAQMARQREPRFAFTAQTYGAIASRSEERVKRAKARAARARARAAVPCEVRWPHPRRRIPIIG